MGLREALFGLLVAGLAVLLLFSGGDAPTEARSTREASSTKVEPGCSYQYTDPETGKTLLLPGEHLPADYRPPPSTGPCDKAVEKTVDNWQRSITNGAIVLGVVIGAFGIFMLLDASFGKRG